MTTTDHDLTRAEKALLLTLALETMRSAGALVSAHGYEQPDEAEYAAIRAATERVLTGTIIGLREPGPDPTPDELSQVAREVAENVVYRVLGDPPDAAPGRPN